MNSPPVCRTIAILTATAAVMCLGFTTAFAQNANLSIVKLGPPDLSAGSDVSYTVIVSNLADVEDSAPEKKITDAVPPGMTFISATTEEGWNCSTPAVGATGAITCVYDNPIAVEQSFSFTFVFHLDSHAEQHLQVCSTATLSREGDGSNSEDNRATSCGTVGLPPALLMQHDVLISQFRFAGPNGNNDDFVELYCNRATACDISGVKLRAYDPDLGGDFTYSFPAHTVIGARQYLLVGDSGGYSLNDYGKLDFDVHTDQVGDYFIDNEGIQIITAEEGWVLDSVGFTGGGNDFAYVEGTGLKRANTARPPIQYSYIRKRVGPEGRLQDTDNNANDFVLVSISGSLHQGLNEPPVSGAPNSQELSSATAESKQIVESPEGSTGSVEKSPHLSHAASDNLPTANVNQTRRKTVRVLPRKPTNRRSGD